MTSRLTRLDAHHDRARDSSDPALKMALPDLIKCPHTLALKVRGAVGTGASGC